MAESVQRKAYIAKDGEILYGDEKDEYLHNGSDDSAEFHKHTGMYIKGGHILCGRAAKKEKLTDDVREAIEKSGMSTWLDKLESEAKQKKMKKELEHKETDQTSKSVDNAHSIKNGPGNGKMNENCSLVLGTNAKQTSSYNFSSVADSSKGALTRRPRRDATGSTNSTNNDKFYDPFDGTSYAHSEAVTDDKVTDNNNNGDDNGTCDLGYNSTNALHPGDTSRSTSSAAIVKRIHHKPRHLNEMQVLSQPGVHLPVPLVSRMHSSNQENHSDVVDYQETTENYSMIDEELCQKLSLAFPKQEGDTRKKTTKSASYEKANFKQELTEGLIKVRKQLEIEEKSTASDTTNSTLPDSTEEPKVKDGDKTLSTSHGTYTSKTDKEVPIPEEKKLPFGSNKNIFTMDSIRNSSKKSIYKIRSNVVGFQ